MKPLLVVPSYMQAITSHDKCSIGSAQVERGTFIPFEPQRSLQPFHDQLFYLLHLKAVHDLAAVLHSGHRAWIRRCWQSLSALTVSGFMSSCSDDPAARFNILPEKRLSQPM